MTVTLAREQTSATQWRGFGYAQPNTSVTADLKEPIPTIGGHRVACDYLRWVRRGTSAGAVVSHPSKNYENTEELFEDYIDLDEWDHFKDSDALPHLTLTGADQTVPVPHGFTLKPFVVLNERNLRHHPSKERCEVEGSEAGCLVKNIKRTSGLTLEEIAPLVGVSRRSLQHWLNGDPISARKEQRLRALSLAIDEIAAQVDGTVRPALLASAPNSLSTYDLLASSRFEAAKAAAIGERSAPDAQAEYMNIPRPSATLKEQLSLIEDGVPDRATRKLDRRLSGRIKR